MTCPSRRDFLARLGVGLAAATAVPSVAWAVTPAPTGLRRLAATWDGRFRWIERERIAEVRVRDGRTALFTADRREISVDGTKVWLGAQVSLVNRDLHLGRRDAEAIVRPLLVPPGRVREARRIVLDAGHGGRDTGTQNPDFRWQEKVFVLDLVQRLEKRLRARGRQVVLIRSDDTFVPLEERSARAVAARADIFLSVHLNAGPAPVSGVETFVLPPWGQPPTSRGDLRAEDQERLPGHAFEADSSRLGFAMQEALRRGTGSPDRGLRRARFAVLKGLACPGALVECGFLSNPTEGRRLADPDYRERLSGWLAAGLEGYGGATGA